MLQKVYEILDFYIESSKFFGENVGRYVVSVGILVCNLI
jgi:hypothetical protein